MRLPPIFVAMALVLLAGIVSVRVFESRIGGATVPGLVLIDAPGLGPVELERLRRRHPAGVLESLPARLGPLQPFGPELLGRLRKRGDLLALYSLVPGSEGVLAPRLWNKRRTSFPRPELTEMGAEATAWLAARQSTVAFCLCVVLPTDLGAAAEAPGSVAGRPRTGTQPEPVGAAPDASLQGAVAVQSPSPDALQSPVQELLQGLLQAAEGLPSFRRGSLVILGAERRDRPGQRWSLRIDLGSWPRAPLPALADLLAARW